MLKTVMVRIVVVLVLINALAGIVALLAGDFGDFEGRVLLTTLSITVASILLLACVAASEARAAGPVSTIGAVLVVIGFAMLIFGIWTEFEVDGRDSSETFWRLTGSAITAAVCLSYVSLMSLPRLAPRYAFVRVGAFAFASLVAAEISLAIWSEELGLDDETLEDEFFRLLGVSAILLAAATVLVPLLQRAGERQRSRQTPGIAFCPACGASLPMGGDGSSCVKCGARFRVDLIRGSAGE